LSLSSSGWTEKCFISLYLSAYRHYNKSVPNKRTHWSIQLKVLVVLIILTIFAYLLYRFQLIITPIVVTLILAYVLTPIVNRVQKRLKISRSLAILTLIILILLLLMTMIMVVVPIFRTQSRELIEDARIWINRVPDLIGREIVLAGFTIKVTTIIDQMSGSIRTMMEPLFIHTFDILIVIIRWIAYLVFIIVIAFYLIKDSDQLNRWFESLPPPGYREDYIRIRDEVNAIWGAFFRGQILLAMIVTVIRSTECLILGLPYALALGLFAGILEFFPSVGHGIWIAVAGMLAFFVGSKWIPVPNWVFLIIVIGSHVLYTNFDMNYLIPRIIGRSVKLPPVVIILGVVAGAMLAGVLGILLAAPTIASLRILGNYVYARLVDEEPFPDVGLVMEDLPEPSWRFWVHHPRGINRSDDASRN
jgi:predicted PurR-regulated permease PerM